jgi:protein-S-isoprenylcysteine O-methyltransferase Ste14
MDLKQLMDPTLIAFAVAVILVVAVLAWLYVRRRRTTIAQLRQRFGPEYDQAVRDHWVRTPSGSAIGGS